MKTPDDPVVVTIHPHQPEPPSAALADVLVVAAGRDLATGRDLAGRRAAELFGRYAGLTMVLAVCEPGAGGRSEAVARFRDGMVLTLDIARSCVPSITAVARLLYVGWAMRAVG